MASKSLSNEFKYVETAIIDAETKLLRGLKLPSKENKATPDALEIINPIADPKVAAAPVEDHFIIKNGVKISRDYKPVDGPKGQVHVIFSTDCNPFQDWQSIVVFHSARTVGQVGPVTRIASGCSEEKKVELTALYKKLYPEYHVHFTPDFKKDEKTGKSYHFYNKPYGLQHWLQYADPPIPDHTIVALIDPDMVFLRPISTQVAGLDNILYNKRAVQLPLPGKIERGRPVGQLYGLGAPWARDFHKKFNRTHICGAGSPCLQEQESVAENHYAVGPPYLVEKRDMWRIAQTWTEFVPRVFEGYPYLLAEMYAYSMAAAHERLPHLQLEQYMVSNVHAGGEGWPHVDKLKENVCVPPDEHGIFYPGVKGFPSLMHYCQGYHAGDVGIMKRRVPQDIFTCESPMLLDPPSDLGSSTYYMKNGVEVGVCGARTDVRIRV